MDLQLIKFKADSTEIDQAAHSVVQLDDTMTKTEKTIVQQNAKMAILRGQAIQLKDGVVELGQGFTQSQAKMLATLATLDATGSQLKELGNSFKDLNALSGVNPFDKVSSGIQKLAQDIRELKTVNDLQAKGFSLTSDQIKALSRDLEGIRQTHREFGSSVEVVNQALEEHTRRFVTLANVKNKYVAHVKESERLQREEIEKTMALERKRQADANSYAAEMAAQSDRMVEQFREVEKNRTLVNNQMMQDWSKAFTTPTKEIQDLSAYFRQLEKDAEAAMRVTRGTELPVDAAVKQFRKDQAKETRDAAAANKYLEDA